MSPDRRKHRRSTPDRRDEVHRLPGVWTEAERQRRVQQIREERHDEYAITVRPANADLVLHAKSTA